MRFLPLLTLCCALHSPTLNGQITQKPDHEQGLWRLYETDQWFTLREEFKNAATPRFYKVILEEAFNSAKAESDLRSFIASEKTLVSNLQAKESGKDPASDRALQHEIDYLFYAEDSLLRMYVRLGRYKDGFSIADDMARVSSTGPRSKSTKAELELLKDYPDQSTDKRGKKPIKLVMKESQHPYIPLMINNVKGEYQFDTGTTTSTVTESEAQRLGLTLMKIPPVGGVADQRVGISIVKRLQVAGVVMSNVEFDIFPDGSPNIIGENVIVPLGSFSWSPKTLLFSVDPKETSKHKANDQNLAFSGGGIATQMYFRNQPLYSRVDTGGMPTYLSPDLLKLYPDLRPAAKRVPKGYTPFVGGHQEVQSFCIASLIFTIAEREVVLSPACMLDGGGPASAPFLANIGNDLISQGDIFAMDFHRMHLSLGGSGQSVGR